MPRYKLVIAYDGTDFCGWQKQQPPGTEPEPEMCSDSLPQAESSLQAEPGESLSIMPSWYAAPVEGRTRLRAVQEVVEHAVREVVREPIILMGSSRTDSGVHARGQVGAFTCTDGTGPLGRAAGWPADRGADRLRMAVNSRLPGDVLIKLAEITRDDFDPIGHAAEKAYSYTIHASNMRPLFDRRTVFHYFRPLDPNPMDIAARTLEGEHDFKAFAAINHGRKTTVRTITACRVIRLSADRIRIDVAGTGFLYNMVRIIAGTLIEIGQGRRKPSSIARALDSGDRRDAGPTAPPNGLCLEWVRFVGDPM